MPAKLTLFSGPACAWKSTLAARLSQETGIPHLEMDQVRRRILPGPRHTRRERVAALRVMLFAAGLLLKNGVSVILDAQYRRAEDREPVRRLAEQTGSRLVLIECAVSPTEAVRRFQLRGPDPVRLDLTPARVERMAREFPYSREGLLLDTDTRSPEECLDRIRRYLAQLHDSPKPGISSLPIPVVAPCACIPLRQRPPVPNHQVTGR